MLRAHNFSKQLVGSTQSKQLQTEFIFWRQWNNSVKLEIYAATPRVRERFDNANICIFPTFLETVGSHVMAWLLKSGENLFCGFSKQ